MVPQRPVEGYQASQLTCEESSRNRGEKETQQLFEKITAKNISDFIKAQQTSNKRHKESMARHIMPTHMPKSQNKEKMMKIATEKLLCTEEPQYKNILIIHGQKEVQKAVKWHRELKKS